jgi:DNA-binding CsgD family transcriptional regulator
LLGHRAADVLGKKCYEILQGRDVFGNRFCHEHCAIRSMADRHEPVRHWQLFVRGASGQRVHASLCVFVLFGGRSDYALVHLLEPCLERPAEENPGRPAKSNPGRAGDAALSGRETEVLRMLAAGAATSDVARRLTISEATVRNHVHHILRKLNVHNRLQAVSLAMRRRLL